MRFLSVLFLFLCLCVNSWGACYPYDVEPYSWQSSNYNGCNCGTGNNGVYVDCNFTFPANTAPCCWGTKSCGFQNASSSRYFCPTPTVVTYRGCDAVNGNGSWALKFTVRCDTQAEADSVACVQNPDLPQCPHCDSTAWTCETSTETTQTTIASENVTCFNGECYGGVYCEYITRNTTTCTNECGTSHTEIAEFPMRYEGACNEETAPDEEQCTSQKCLTNNGFYHLYRLCKNRNLVNGEAQTIPVFEGGGLGTCANAGYKEENPNVNGFSSSSVDSSSVPKECYTMGINCPVPSDTTNYIEQSNRTQENGCICEPYDGTKFISQIVCPDGSSSIFYGSCDDWKPKSSSSYNPPESSSSGSENPPTSSGGNDQLAYDWVKYSQGEEIKALLGQVVLNTAKENQITINNQSNLSEYTTNGNETYLELNRNDSLYQVATDTNKIMAWRDSLFNPILSKIDSNNSIIDTLVNPNYNGCPTVSILGGGQPVQAAYI